MAGAELEKLGLLQKPDQRSASQPGSEASASRNGRQRPLPAKLSIVQPGKGTDLKGPDPFFTEPTNNEFGAERQYITGTEPLVPCSQIRKWRPQRGEAAQAVRGFALLYKVFGKRVATSRLHHCGNASGDHEQARALSSLEKCTPNSSGSSRACRLEGILLALLLG